jgi:prepilin peptidase CpaA
MNPEMRALFDLLSMLIANPRTGVLIGLLAAAAWSDYRSARIPNGLVFGGALVGLAYNTLVPEFHVSPAFAFSLALGGLACGLAATLPFYLLRAMGAGDVKLMAMSGAFLGYPDAVWAIAGSFLAGGVLSLAYLLWKGALARALLNIVVMIQGAVPGAGSRRTGLLAIDAKASAGTLPYGVAIAAGTIGYLIARQFGWFRW